MVVARHGTALIGHYRSGVCSSGKRAFVSRRAAKEMVKHLAKVGEGHLRPYVCRECGGWHVGHLDYPRKRGLR